MLSCLSIKVQLKCPTCQANYLLDLSSLTFDSKRFTRKIHIRKDTSCEHEYIAFLSKKGVLLGYETVDYVFQKEKKKNESQSLLKGFIDQYGEGFVSLMVRGMLLNHTIYFQNSKKIDNVLLNSGLNQLLPEEFRKNEWVRVVSQEEIDRFVGKDYILLDPYKKKIINPKKKKNTDIEREIIEKTLGILNPDDQVVISQAEIGRLCNKALYLIDKVITWEKVDDSMCQNVLEKDFDQKLKKHEYKLIKEIIEQRFNQDLSKLTN